MHGALELLARRDYFVAEIEDRLRRKGFADDEIAAAVTRLAELGYVDDLRLARRFVALRSMTKGWGPRRLEAELRRRGVGEETAREAAVLAPDETALALETALRRAEIRARADWWRLPDRRARMVSSLIGRGFAAAEARAAVDRLAAVRERDDDARDDEL